MNSKCSTSEFAARQNSSKYTKKQSKKNKINPKKMNRGIQAYINASQSGSTKRAYASDLRHFLAQGGSVPCTPKCLARYLANCASDGLAVATLERRVSAIHRAHVDQHHPSPAHADVVRQVLQGIRRTFGTKQRQAKPFLKNDLLDALEAVKTNCMPLRAARDRALLLVGFASAMRRSELVGVRVEHLAFTSNGLEIELPFSKTDQDRHGRTVFIPHAYGSHCPVKALSHWLKMAEIRTGHVFRAVNRHDGVANRGLTAQSVALIVKAAVMRTGEDAKNFSGHSLRAGYCTSAAEQGLQSWQIRAQTGHVSDETLAKYIRPLARQKIQSLM